MHVCMHACICAWGGVHMYACMHAYAPGGCVCLCMHVCMCTRAYEDVGLRKVGERGQDLLIEMPRDRYAHGR